VDPAAETEGVIAGERTEPTLEDRLLQLKMKLIEDEVQAGRLKRARQLVLTVLSDAHGGAERIVDLAKRMAADTGDATVMCVDALLEAARDGRGEHHRGRPHAGGLGAAAARGWPMARRAAAAARPHRRGRTAGADAPRK
jgi:hypothetical protein